MAMASATTAAAKMLLSGSMPSADGLMNSNFLARSLLPCASSIAISASAPFPTVTLDLTQSPNPLQGHPSQFPIPFSNTHHQNHSNPAAALLPQIFGQALYNQSKFSGLQMSSQDTDHANPQLSPLLHQGQLNETVNALAADPSFTAALAAAITSFLGNNLNNNSNNNATTNVTPNSNNNKCSS